jgi:hypothetical protein
MGRIRTVKPELFGHEDLFDLERETGLPLRLAFIGLFTCCDREGRFKWRPRTLKKDVLPHDEIDFSRVLDALATGGFVRKYACGDEEYGVIPTWNKHQVINNRESSSEIPAPDESSYISMTSTRARRVNDAKATETQDGKAEGKGKEGKGKEGENTLVELKPDAPKKVDIVEKVFSYWQDVMQSPKSALDKDRRSAIEKALKNYSPGDICEAIRGCAMTEHNMGINERNTKYNGLHIILKNADNIDRFIAKSRSNPGGQVLGTVQSEEEFLAGVQAALGKMNGYGPAASVDDENTIDMEQ